MIGRWISYRLRMKAIRQKYFTLMRKTVTRKIQRLQDSQMRGIRKGIIYGLALGTVAYFSNQIYSEHHESKQIKQTLIKNYPENTFIVSLGVEISPVNRELQLEDNSGAIEQKQLSKCLIKFEQSQEINLLRKKLGDIVIIYSPLDFDQLCNIVELCHKYRHKVLVGNYPIVGSGESQVVPILNKIPQPTTHKKLIIVDVSHLNNTNIDEINSILQADVGVNCQQLNQSLIRKGYMPLFATLWDDCCLYDVICQNYPLRNNESLMSRLINMKMVSAEGNGFKSATDLDHSGQIPNLNPLFVGTGGAFAVPATARIRISRGGVKAVKTETVELRSSNKSELIMKLQAMVKTMEEQGKMYSLEYCSGSPQHQIRVQVGEGEKEMQTSGNYRIKYIFGVNLSIFQQLILGNLPPSYRIVFEGNLIKVYLQEHTPSQDQMPSPSVISTIGLLGGILIWCHDHEQYQFHKKRADVTQASAQLMRKIVQVREGLDKRKVFESHQRYEQYYAKGLFRRMTQFFW